MPKIWISVVGIAVFCGALSCTSPDQPGQTEPVAPADEQTPYPEDPDMAKGDKESQPPSVAENSPSDEPAELTDDPFKKPPEAAPPPDEKPSSTEQGEDNLPVPDEGEPYGGAFEEPQPKYEPVPDETDITTPPSEPKKSGGGKISKPLGGKTARYVEAILLNVREKPSQKSPIVRRLLGGAKVHAEIKQGGWAKIGDNQWVRSKFLSTAPTRKVSRAEAEKAWRKSKYKDKWQPKK